MAIKKCKLKFKVSLLVILLFSISYSMTNISNSSQYGGMRSPKISDEELIDKVYAFTISNSSLFFDKSLLFEEFTYYYVSVMVVTPHHCAMNITLWDPEGDQYEIYYRENMNQGENSEIPFGTALTGNYSMLFDVILEYNLNIRIKIEKGEGCLRNNIDPEVFDDRVLYNVKKFYNGESIQEYIYLKTDYYYKFYFGRVSAISANKSYNTQTDYTITCPEDIEYIIYENRTLPEITDIIFFRFGTAVQGLYTVLLTVYCDVPHVNLAYAVIEGSKISDVINGTEPEPTNGTDTPTFIISIPKEWTIGFVAVIGILVVIVIGVVIYHRKRNVLNLNL
ncbi:MAG: hypothetical protein ACFE8L_10520 [Candidatus Hodarchaeota archaeon]